MIEEVPSPSDTANDIADEPADKAGGGAANPPPDQGSLPVARIKVIGIGGGGSNAVNHMIEAGVKGMEFAAVNTDAQALRVSRAPLKLQLGKQLTQGYGAGSDHKVGRNAALEDTDSLVEMLSGSDMVFVTAGLGGGTGTGAAPVVASLSKEMGALTVAVVTKPFAFEGPRRMSIAEEGLAELAETVDTIITIPNEYLLAHVNSGTSFFESFRIADDILLQAVQGISDIITIPGIINCDFADVRTIMLGMGYAVMGTATSSGSSAAIEAARAAISSPLIENANIDGARGILINVTGSSQLSLHEVHEASMIIQKAANENANIIFGVVSNDAMGENVKVTVIATGFHDMQEAGADGNAGNAQEPEQDSAAVFADPAPEPDGAAPPIDSSVWEQEREAERQPGASDPEPPMDAAAPEPEQPEAPLPTAAEKFSSHAGEPEKHTVEEEDIERPAFFRRHFSK